MEKIIAKELAPEDSNLLGYFDGDYFRGEGFEKEEDKQYGKLFISSGRSGINKEDYDDTIAKIENLADDFENVLEHGDSYGGYTTYKEVMEDYGISYSPNKCHELKELLLNVEYPISGETVAEYLEIESGKDFECKTFTGYTQGEYCDVIYSPEYYSDEIVKESACMYLGKGTEFVIDDCHGYFVTDEVRWKEDNTLIKELANMSGYKPEELDVRLYEGNQNTPVYKSISYNNYNPCKFDIENGVLKKVIVPEDITSVNIPDGVKKIGDKAFFDCKNLENIKIPDSVESIEKNAFMHCASLKSIEIPESVKSIREYAFASCISLESIEIPESVQHIGKGAFGNCISLESVEIPDSITNIAVCAFHKCESLESIEIPNSVTGIDAVSFSDCKNLKSITIPDNVEYIGDYAFENCDKLTIHCNKNSYAEEFAKKNDIKYETNNEKSIEKNDVKKKKSNTDDFGNR